MRSGASYAVEWHRDRGMSSPMFEAHRTRRRRTMNRTSVRYHAQCTPGGQPLPHVDKTVDNRQAAVDDQPPERGKGGHKRLPAQTPDVASQRPVAPLHVVFSSLTRGKRWRKVQGSPDRTQTPNHGPRGPHPPTGERPQDHSAAATARTMRQLPRSPHRHDGGKSRWLEVRATRVR